jgi:hypothetical protein
MAKFRMRFSGLWHRVDSYVTTTIFSQPQKHQISYLWGSTNPFIFSSVMMIDGSKILQIYLLVIFPALFFIFLQFSCSKCCLVYILYIIQYFVCLSHYVMANTLVQNDDSGMRKHIFSCREMFGE